MKVADAMIQEVITIEPSASLVEAAKRMREGNVGILPVVDEDEVQGVITDRDLVVRAIAENADLASIPVGDCATGDPICAHPDWSVEQAMEAMARYQVGRLPVIDDDNHLLGIVTLSSLALRSRGDKKTLDAAREVSRRSLKGSATPSATGKRGARREAPRMKRAG
jgi:CBS domain-containing protein